MTELVVPYEPREQFIAMHNRTQRFGSMLCHRRAGKTVACVAELVIRSLRTKKRRARFAYIGPFRQQAKEIAWQYLKDFTEGLRKGPPRESDLQIRLHNDAIIQLYGADNPDALRGLYFDGVVVDEYADCRPSIWGEILLPALTDRHGWCLFVGTIKGKNHFYHRVEKSRTDPNEFFLELKGSTSGILSPAQLADLRDQMSEAQYQQEIECNPNAAIEGTYYSQMIADAEVQGRIGDYPHDPHEMVHVSADLGWTDSTAFWFWQLTPEGPVMIDYEEHDGRTVEFYVNMLQGKGYDYADIWLPHDAKTTTMQTGRSTVEQMLEADLPCKVVPRLAVQHGIDAARLMLPNTRFDRAHCADGIEALRAYRRQWNEKTQQYANNPLHDWASNGSDAYRYFALVTDENLIKEAHTPTSTPILKAPEYTLDELWADHEEQNWRNKVIRL